MVVWVGQQVAVDFVLNVFGVHSQAEINVDSVRICVLWVKNGNNQILNSFEWLMVRCIVHWF